MEIRVLFLTYNSHEPFSSAKPIYHEFPMNFMLDKFRRTGVNITTQRNCKEKRKRSNLFTLFLVWGTSHDKTRTLQ